MKKSLGMLVLASLACFSLQADQLNLVDGSIVKGKITEVFNGKVKITTDFAGDLVVDKAKVVQMTTDGPVMVALTTEKTQGQITAKDGKMAVANKPIEASAIQAVWKLDAMDPTLPKPPEGRKWAYEASFDITGKTGNTEKTNIGGGLKATLKGPEDKLLLYLRGKYGRENHVKNEEEIIAGADFERMFGSTNSSWYARMEVEHDEINNYDMYYTGAAGYGYYFIKNDDAQIRLRAGLNYTRKEYANDMETDDGIGVDFNYHHEFKIKKFLGIKDFGKLVSDVTYTPTFEEWSDDYRIYHESSIDIPLGGSKHWLIRLGVSNEYNNKVAKGDRRVDTTYFGRLVLNWD